MPKKLLKRFFAFAGDTHYPMGGWSDFKGSSDVFMEAVNMVRSHDWAQVIDSANGEEMWSMAGGYDTGYYKWIQERLDQERKEDDE